MQVATCVLHVSAVCVVFVLYVHYVRVLCLNIYIYIYIYIYVVCVHCVCTCVESVKCVNLFVCLYQVCHASCVLLVCMLYVKCVESVVYVTHHGEAVPDPEPAPVGWTLRDVGGLTVDGNHL